MKTTLEDARTITLDERAIDYDLRRTGAARARIRVTPAGVEVLLPRASNDERAITLLRENSDWVLSQLDWLTRCGSLRRAKPAASHLMLRGRQTQLKIERRGSRVQICHRDGEIVLALPQQETSDAKRVLERWLRRQARADVLKNIEVRAREMGIEKLQRVYIFDQKTKWGGCSARRNLSFNWRLVLAPPAALDYIVVHELAHLIEPNHSTKFWLLVASHCPDYLHWKNWLRENGHSLQVLAASFSEEIGR